MRDQIDDIYEVSVLIAMAGVDPGLISEGSFTEATSVGLNEVATRLNRDDAVTSVLEAATAAKKDR